MSGKFTLPDGWKRVALGGQAEIIFSNVDKKSAAGERPVRLCNYTDVYYKDHIDCADGLMEATATVAEIRKFSLRRGDVLITKDSEENDDIGVPALVTRDLENVLCGYHLAIIRAKTENLNGAFVSQSFQSHYVRQQLFKEANGVTRFGLGIDAIRTVELVFPPALEQVRIAEVLLAWDKASEVVRGLIEQKRERRRGLMQQLLTGNMRFGEFKKHPWRFVRLGELVEPKNRYESWDDGRLYRLAGVRRNGGGLFFRDELPGTEIKVKLCKKIKAGDFLISRRQMTYGGMAIVPPEFDGFDVNDEYEVLVVKQDADFDMRFFNYLSETPELKYAAYVASNGFFAERLRLNLDLDQFLSHRIAVPPSSKELRKIVSVLDAASSEIELLQKQLAALTEQKRGLMQKLLTGEIRVKTEMLKAETRNAARTGTKEN